jgi:hypothetical protein
MPDRPARNEPGTGTGTVEDDGASPGGLAPFRRVCLPAATSAAQAGAWCLSPFRPRPNQEKIAARLGKKGRPQ